MKLKDKLKRINVGYIDTVGRASTIGLHLVSGIIVGGVIGFFLDRWLETSPWLFIIFLIVGVLAGFKNMYLDAKRLIASQEKPDAQATKRQD